MSKKNGFTPSEKVMQVALFNRARFDYNHKMVVPNIANLYRWEADLISITKSNYVHEYEIKRSRADYLADFRNKPRKHHLLETKDTGFYPHIKPAIPNYFWFVTFDGMEIEPPKYAGWLEVFTQRVRYSDGDVTYLSARINKKAPLLHRINLPELAMLKIYENMAIKFHTVFRKAYPIPKELIG